MVVDFSADPARVALDGRRRDDLAQIVDPGGACKRNHDRFAFGSVRSF